MLPISVDKPSLTKRPEIKTYGQLFDVIESEGIYLKGGKGNKVLSSYGYTKGSIEEKQNNSELQKLESKLVKILTTPNEPLFDYFDESTHPKEWDNIQWGKDQYKLTRMQIHMFRLMFGLGISGLVGAVAWIISMF